jgi:16S rRNA processing protein RimM
VTGARHDETPAGPGGRERLVAIGEITRAHGLRGEVRVTPLTDRPERFEALTECVLWDASRDERETRRITTARRHGDAVLLGLAGVDDPEAAALVVGRLVAVPASAALPLAPGQFYPWQLEGARVVLEDGREIGRVAGIEGSAAQDVYVVRDGEREHLIPAVPEIVLDVDVAAGRVVVRPPEGLLEL